MITRFFRWLVSLFGGKTEPVRPVPVYIVPSPEVMADVVTNVVEVVRGRGTLNANFLAFGPDWEMADDRDADCGLFYYRWDDEKRARFRAAYLAGGYTDLPFCVMPGGNGLPTTKEAALDLALRFEDELHQDGMRWLHMLITNRGDSPMSYGESVAWAEYIIPRTNADFICTGWEFPDPTRGAGYAGADGIEWGWSGDCWKLLDFLSVLRDLAPTTPLDLHFRPGWWAGAGPHDTDDHTLWREGRDRGLTFGLLYQPRLDEVTADHPDPNDGAAFWAFEYPWSDVDLPGIAGRVRHYMGDGAFRYFEVARHQSTWDVRMDRYNAYEDTSGGQG